ncbi:putative ABC transport system permease protein [Lacrimispora xylanisolvens]|uniref:Putative ABC transport system permease protein n=1 Tax=Lacrimispora xylanisolvens TaxID=384636 RepID=A0A2S6HTG2_9FIRM|nr:ABC transporter permease [Hungatella xylanolytica]PPK80950.1 putative ABC transport system permease protein [Hungatella xylanolytica]
MLFENMTMAVHAIKANKMRSLLTMLGIIIGIGSVIAIVSIGDTMRFMISDIYKDVGTTLAYVYIWPSDGSDMRQSDYFSVDDVDRIREVYKDEITYIDSSSQQNVEAVFGRNKVKFALEGIGSNYPNVHKINIIYGRNLNEGDIKGRKNHVVLEAEGAKELFGTENAVGKSFRTTIYGDTDDYDVVGVYRKEENPFLAMVGGSGENKEGYLPESILVWPNDTIYNIRLYAKEGTDMSSFSERFSQYIAKSKNRKREDVTFYSVSSEMGSVDQIMGGLSAAVGGIAAISLLVGGIGIMNIMLVSVTERTREIGIRKALGAKTWDVMVQFLTESAILSAMGGIIGVITGAGLVFLGGTLLGMTVVIKPMVIIIAVGFSALVGVFFGIYPASKAAGKDPIEALRYE